MKWLAVVLAVAGCGDNLPGPAEVHNGSRLKVVWYEYEGGARERERDWYYDSVLAERCTSEEWSDGRRYCKPHTDEAVYVTEGCTRSLGRSARGVAPAPFFATTFHVKDRALPSRVFRRGAATLAPVAVWEKRVDGCFGPQPAGDFEYFELGEEITDLVRLHRSEPRGYGELAIIDEVSDDGLSVPAALYDRDVASECLIDERPNAARLECVPRDAPQATYFIDAACTNPVVASAAGMVPTIAAAHFTTTGCWQSYAVGARLVGGALYADLGSGCVPVAPPVGLSLYVMADRKASPVLARIPAGGAERVQPIERAAAELSVADPWMFDADLATDCAHDASLRCVPRTAATVEGFYADPQCSTALQLALVPSGACDPPSRYAREGDLFYPLLAPYPYPIYWISTGGTCGFYGPPVPFVAYTIGPAIDPATFATAELMIDP
ncbi:MAG TPA: hypothetical protein VFS15_28290 [Kofleriaceae bacterium]|nr:hypothetical protein [Kofleriaceae bacterium]